MLKGTIAGHLSHQPKYCGPKQTMYYVESFLWSKAYENATLSANQHSGMSFNFYKSLVCRDCAKRDLEPGVIDALNNPSDSEDDSAQE